MSAPIDLEQIIVPSSLQPVLREWLASRGLYLYPIPVEDDLPTFGIAVAALTGSQDVSGGE